MTEAQDKLAVARESLDAFQRGDLDGWLALHDPECELHSLRTLLGGPAYHGHLGLRDWWSDVGELWEALRIDVRDIQPAGGSLLVVADVHARARESGAELSQREVAWVLRVEGGRIVESRQFFDVAAALEALGLMPEQID